LPEFVEYLPKASDFGDMCYKNSLHGCNLLNKKKNKALDGGRQESNLARKFAMYCCQQLADMPLKSIAAHFNLSHPGSVS